MDWEAWIILEMHKMLDNTSLMQLILWLRKILYNFGNAKLILMRKFKIGKINILIVHKNSMNFLNAKLG